MVKAFFGVSEREPKRCFARNDFSEFYSTKDWHREQTVVQEYVRGGGGLLSNSFSLGCAQQRVQSFTPKIAPSEKKGSWNGLDEMISEQKGRREKTFRRVDR